jgi:excisionase family DNA binding protein
MANPKFNEISASEACPRLAFRIREVSEMTGIPASTIRSMIRDGEINPITGFRTWLIAKAELDRLLEKRLRNE